MPAVRTEFRVASHKWGMDTRRLPRLRLLGEMATGECVFFFFFFEKSEWVDLGTYSIRLELPRHSIDPGRQPYDRRPSPEDERIANQFTADLERELSRILEFRVRLTVASLARGSLIQIGSLQGDAGGILNRLLKISGILASLGAGALSFEQAIAGYPEAKRSLPVLVEDVASVFRHAVTDVGAKNDLTIIDGRMTPHHTRAVERDMDAKLSALAKDRRPGEGERRIEG